MIVLAMAAAVAIASAGAELDREVLIMIMIVLASACTYERLLTYYRNSESAFIVGITRPLMHISSQLDGQARNCKLRGVQGKRRTGRRRGIGWCARRLLQCGARGSRGRHTDPQL